MISNIANSKYTARICPEKCREFGEWYRAYRRDHKETCTGENVHLQINKETGEKVQQIFYLFSLNLFSKFIEFHHI